MIDDILDLFNVGSRKEAIGKWNEIKSKCYSVLSKIPPYQYAIGGAYVLGHFIFKYTAELSTSFFFIRYPISKLCVGFWGYQLAIKGISKVSPSLADRLSYYIQLPFRALSSLLIPKDIQNIFIVFKSIFSPCFEKLSSLSMSEITKSFCYVTAKQEPIKYNVKRQLTKKDAPFLDLVRHYSKYMTAAYGHIMIRGVLRKGDANDFRDMIMNPRDRSLFIDSMCDYCNIESKDIIYKQFESHDLSFNVLSNETVKNPQYSTSAENNDIESNIPKTITVQVEKEIHIKTPPYFVILDHEYERVVLLVRGTFSANDFVTDLAGHKYKWKEGNAHQGMAMIADYLIHDIQLNAILKQALNNYPNYRLIAVGHSLGAAIAALTCIGWKDNNMYSSFEPQCFGYACPPCLSSNIKNKGHHYVHCFVNEDDVVPRLNKQSIEDLIGRIYDTASQVEPKKSSFKNRVGLFFQTIFSKKEKKSESMSMPGEFIIPGEVYLIHPCYENYEQWEMSRNNTLKKFINSDYDSEKFKIIEKPKQLSPVMLYLGHGENFPNQIIVSSNMLFHHFTFNYENIIESVYNAVMQ